MRVAARLAEVLAAVAVEEPDQAVVAAAQVAAVAERAAVAGRGPAEEVRLNIRASLARMDKLRVAVDLAQRVA